MPLALWVPNSYPFEQTEGTFMKLSRLNFIAILSLLLVPAAFADSASNRIEAAVQKQFEGAGYDVISVTVKNYNNPLLKVMNAASVALNEGGTGRSAVITVKLPRTEMALQFECTAWIPLNKSTFSLDNCGEAVVSMADKKSKDKANPFGYNTYFNF